MTTVIITAAVLALSHKNRNREWVRENCKYNKLKLTTYMVVEIAPMNLLLFSSSSSSSIHCGALNGKKFTDFLN